MMKCNLKSCLSQVNIEEQIKKEPIKEVAGISTDTKFNKSWFLLVGPSLNDIFRTIIWLPKSLTSAMKIPSKEEEEVEE